MLRFVRPQRLLAFSLLVFTLKELQLSEPLIHGVGDFRCRLVFVLHDRHVCVESFEVRLLALLGVNCRIEVVANRFPRTGAVGKRIPQEVRTSEIGGRRPRPRLTF